MIQSGLGKSLEKSNNLNNVVLEILWHVSVGHLCQVVVRLWPPTVDTVELEQKTGLPVIIAVMFFRDTLDVTSLQRKKKLVSVGLS